MDKLRVGVIGCGKMGQSHFGAYSRVPDRVEVAALCDVREEALAAASGRWPGARAARDYREMLEPGDLDLVSVVTMPQTHCEITVAALEAGAHVLCEKPFAMHLAEADRMLAAAERAGRLIQVGTNMRHMIEAGILKELVESGALGKPTYIRAWTYTHDIPWWGPHQIKRVSAGGALASSAIHLADVALWVAGSPGPVAVSGSTHRIFPKKRAETAPSGEARDSYDVEDIAAAHIRLSDGGTLILEGTWAHDRAESERSFEMICERGTVCFNPAVGPDGRGGEGRRPHTGRLRGAGGALFVGRQREQGDLPLCRRDSRRDRTVAESARDPQPAADSGLGLRIGPDRSRGAARRIVGRRRA